jgi:hypothetical protein
MENLLKYMVYSSIAFRLGPSVRLGARSVPIKA